MKRIVLACMLMVFQASFAHKADNPYYNFVKSNITLFIQGLTDNEIQQCLNFLSGNTEQKGLWFDRMAPYIEYMSEQFLDIYNACDATDCIKNKNKLARWDEFNIYTMAALYRLVYKQATKRGIETVYIEPLETDNVTKLSQTPLANPDEFEAECLIYIHADK